MIYTLVQPNLKKHISEFIIRAGFHFIIWSKTHKYIRIVLNSQLINDISGSLNLY